MRLHPTVTIVIDPYGEYRRPREAGIPFESTLRGLLDQTYPEELVTIILTCSAAEMALVQPLIATEPRIRAVTVPEGSGYYQKKNFGAMAAESELVLLADGDCLYPSDWVREMVDAFERGGPRVAAVQGVSQFAPGRYAHILNPVYWRGYEPEGPISQIYSAHNLGLRRQDLPQLLFEDTPLRAGLERPLSTRIRRAGRLIWHNRRTRVLHEGSSSLAELRLQALGRGYYRMILWRRHPTVLDRLLRPLGYLAIPIYVGLVSLRDSGRQFRALRARGLGGLKALKLPAYIAFTVGFHAVGGVSMVRVMRALSRTGEFPAPEFYGSDGPPDLGDRSRMPGRAGSPTTEARD
jgi:glycosyltransferase involved in cell wall biosynthesis